jgi:hypothetical protein
VAAFADALKAAGKPVFWAGLAPVRSGVMSRDYSSFNDIVREQVDAKGLRFVDTWNGFADEEGKFVSVGPAVSGQSVQLRDSDGLNFTRAGQRKLAYFVEQELNDVLRGEAIAALPPGEAAPGAAAPVDEGPKIGPMVAIDALTAAPSGVLSGAAPAGATGPSAPQAGIARASVVSGPLAGGAAADAPAGRVDDYTWPPVAPAPAAAAPGAERTPVRPAAAPVVVPLAGP